MLNAKNVSIKYYNLLKKFKIQYSNINNSEPLNSINFLMTDTLNIPYSKSKFFYYKTLNMKTSYHFQSILTYNDME